MQPLTQALAPWHDFYTVLGEASATMTGLLFVAASVGSGVFAQSQRGALRMFLSGSVVQFGSILITSLAVLSPFQRWGQLGGVVIACGAFGAAYAAVAWRDALRDGVFAKIDLEDRIWYAVAPSVGYCCKMAAGLALILGKGIGCAMLGAAMGALLLVAIHNAWDITIWSVTRHKK